MMGNKTKSNNDDLNPCQISGHDHDQKNFLKNPMSKNKAKDIKDVDDKWSKVKVNESKGNYNKN